MADRQPLHKSQRSALLVLSLCCSFAAGAQDRMPPIPADRLSSEQIAAVEELRRVRGTELQGPWIPLLRSPEVLSRARAMGDYLRFRSALPPRLSEFLILLTAREWQQQYEWHAHRQIAIEAGVAPAAVEAIAEGRRPPAMGTEESALYELFAELHRNHSVSDTTYAQAVAQFGERGVIDALGIIGYYTLLAMVMNTARTPVPEGATPGLEHLP